MTKYKVYIYSISKYGTDSLNTEASAVLKIPNQICDDMIMNADNLKNIIQGYDGNQVILYSTTGAAYRQLNKDGYYITYSYHNMSVDSDSLVLYYGQTLEHESDWLDKYKFVCQNYVCNSKQYLMIYNFIKLNEYEI